MPKTEKVSQGNDKQQEEERRLTRARADLEAERNALSLEQRRHERKKESLVHEVTVRVS